MGLIRRYRTALARHHRSRGFGIHSPSAYRFVTEVLRERCPYYAYDEIRAWRKRLLAEGVRPMMSNHEAQLLFRIVNHFAPLHVWQVGLGGILPIVTALLTSSKTQVYFYDETHQIKETWKMLGEHFDRHRVHPMSALCTPPSSGGAGGGEPFGADGRPNFILINALPDSERATIMQRVINEWLQGNCVVIMRNLHRDAPMRQLWHQAKAVMTHGHTFSNGKTAILVARPGIPLQHFDIWL